MCTVRQGWDTSPACLGNRNCDSLRFSPRFLFDFTEQFLFASQMWAARPHLASIFEKLLDQKTFVCLRLVLGIPPESGSARLGHIPSLPLESQLPLKPCISLQPFDFKGNCDSFDLLLDFCLIFIVRFHLLRKCGLLAHTSPAFLKNCCTEKLFVCLRLIIKNVLLHGFYEFVQFFVYDEIRCIQTAVSQFPNRL